MSVSLCGSFSFEHVFVCLCVCVCVSVCVCMCESLSTVATFAFVWQSYMCFCGGHTREHV